MMMMELDSLLTPERQPTNNNADFSIFLSQGAQYSDGELLNNIRISNFLRRRRVHFLNPMKESQKNCTSSGQDAPAVYLFH